MNKEVVLLTGKDLNIEQVVKIARERANVKISDEAMARVERSRKLIFELADKNVPVYGLNRGVGWNKDKKVFHKYFEEYNKNLIYAHCVAVGPEASEEEVRAILAARLNTILVGCTGIKPEIALMYRDFLNHEIHPVIPLRGSVGEGDIANLSHIGLAMIGEGDAFYKGERMTAVEALNKAGLSSVALGPKDGLGIVSSNALAAGIGAIVLKEIEELIEEANIIYCLSLEGLNGSVLPLDESVNRLRGFKGQYSCAEEMRAYLDGSYLWEEDSARALQDSLSFRGGCSVHGAVRDALAYVWDKMLIQLNSTDDNPCIVVDEERLSPCSNYETTTWAVGFEMLGIALSHMSKAACHRTIKLSSPSFTKLSRFLTPSEGEIIAYGTIQKPFTSLDTEIRHLANPATMDYFPVAGEIEDHASNTPFVITKTKKIVDNLRYILGMEALHAAQAIDLREPESLGKGTKAAFEEFRSEIPFLEKDRCLTIDIKKAYDIIRTGRLIRAVRQAMD